MFLQFPLSFFYHYLLVYIAVYVSEFHDKGCLEFQRPSGECPSCTLYIHRHCWRLYGRLLQLRKLHSWRQLQIVSKCWNSIIVFPSNENGWSSKFQYDMIRPTTTLTSIYLQLAFIVIGRAAEILHEGSREISMEKYGQKENLPANLLKLRSSGEISSVSSVSVYGLMRNSQTTLVQTNSVRECKRRKKFNRETVLFYKNKWG